MSTYNQINNRKQHAEEAAPVIFFMLHTADGGWKSTICSSLADAVNLWQSRKDSTHETGVLHIGFDSPPSQELDSITDQYRGRVLITTAAKYILPTSYVVSTNPIVGSNNFPIYLALKGWGYYLEDTTIAANEISERPQGWIALYIKENSNMAPVLSRHKIYDDASYLNNEYELNALIRHQLGVFRTHYLVGPNCKDPCEIARAAPPWFAKRKLTSLNTANKVDKIFRQNNLQTVADLAAWDLTKLYKEPWVGYKTIYYMTTCLNIALNDTSALTNQLYPLTTQMPDIKANLNTTISFLENVKHFLLLLNKYEYYIFERYLGFHTPPQSMRQIIESYGCDEKFLHDAKSSLIKKMKQHSFWTTMLQKIALLLSATSTPLSIARIEMMDSWFKGVSEYPMFLKKLALFMTNDNIHILKINEQFYFSMLTQTVWNGIVEKAKTRLYSGAIEGLDETKAYAYVQGLLPDGSKGFANILWEQVTQLCHFKIAPDGTRVLTGYGKNMNYIVATILRESDVPLHYYKITELANRRQTRTAPLQPKKVLAIAREVGLMFNVGTYGHSKHIPFSTAQMNQIRSICEHALSAQQIKRQWHVDEILSALPIQVRNIYTKLDKYILNIILTQSKLLQRIRKMVWTMAGLYEANYRSISEVQAVVNILEIAGHPLSGNEIKERMIMVRGVGDLFIIPLCDPLVRIQPGVWGLNDRDVPISRATQKVLIEELVVQLNKKQISIHLNEVADILPLKNCPAYTFTTIAMQDKRIKMSKTKYIYLSEWNGVRIK